MGGCGAATKTKGRHTWAYPREPEQGRPGSVAFQFHNTHNTHGNPEALSKHTQTQEKHSNTKQHSSTMQTLKHKTRHSNTKRHPH
eukprot:229099-Chlamydomonas_euryale.AAC.11